MHFDQFNAVKKENKCISLLLTSFSGVSHNAHFQAKTIAKSIPFFFFFFFFFFLNILVYSCRPNTHLPNPINAFSVTAHAHLIFEKLLASCIRWFI